MSKRQKPNLARLVYDAYPHSDLLPIDPDQDCRDLATLRHKAGAGDIGDPLFAFIVQEMVEGGDSTRKGAIRVLARARADIEAVLRALDPEPPVYVRTWSCPGCGHRVECSYEHLATSGTPICTDCDREMELA